MKQSNKMLIFLSSIFLGISCGTAIARVYVVQSMRQFNLKKDKAGLSVVLFYKNDKKNDLLRVYEKVSSQRFYDDADVVFMRMSSMSNDANVLMQRYGIDIVPSMVLFSNGNMIIDQKGQNALLSGAMTGDEINEFIKKYCGKDIEMRIEKKERDRIDRIKKNNDESNPYFDSPAMLYKSEDKYWRRPLSYPGSDYGDNK